MGKKKDRPSSFLSDEEVKQVLEALPHGSGIDGKWEHKVAGSRDKFTCALHVMDENGMYDGWQDFAVTIWRHQKDVLNPLKGAMAGKVQIVYRAGDREFKITFGEPRREKYITIWREYLYEIIGHELDKLGIGRIRMDLVNENAK
jgi:hypothetical protein